MRLLPACLLLTSCASLMNGAQVVPEVNSTPYTPTGEISIRGFGASFDQYRVRSAISNLAVRTDGSWALGR